MKIAAAEENSNSNWKSKNSKASSANSDLGTFEKSELIPASVPNKILSGTVRAGNPLGDRWGSQAGLGPTGNFEGSNLLAYRRGAQAEGAPRVTLRVSNSLAHRGG